MVFFYCLAFAMSCVRLFKCALWSPAWLSSVMSICEFVTFPLVSWVRGGT